MPVRRAFEGARCVNGRRAQRKMHASSRLCVGNEFTNPLPIPQNTHEAGKSGNKELRAHGEVPAVYSGNTSDEKRDRADDTDSPRPDRLLRTRLKERGPTILIISRYHFVQTGDQDTAISFREVAEANLQASMRSAY